TAVFRITGDSTIQTLTDPMNTDEILNRLRIGLALIVGYISGQGLAQLDEQYGSELFVLGFLLGFFLTRAGFWGVDRLKRRAGG
ncbi:MAG: hypothetical protein ACKN9W_10645, partial [Methylococcus sp.]